MNICSGMAKRQWTPWPSISPPPAPPSAKDLTLLEEEGEVIRTYGGVVLSRDDGDQPIDRKTHINTEKNATSPAPPWR